MNRAPNRLTPAIVLAVAAATLASACTAAAPEPRPHRTAPAEAWVDPATRTELRRFYGQKLTWSACGEAYQCAELTVPMDYARPENGRTFVLPVARAATAKPGRRIGAIIANPGGPGGSGVTSLLEEGMAEAFSAQVRERFDIVSFDPRGVGGSDPVLTCGADDESAREGAAAPESGEAAMVADPFYPRTAPERTGVLAEAEREAERCARHSAGILPHVGTRDVARDVDVLRAVLGEKELTYFGWSYGTSLGTAYAEQFPRRVRAMVLDGAIDPSLEWSERAIGQGVGFQRAVTDYTRHCADFAGDSCPGSTPEERAQLIEGLFAKAAREPLPVPGQEYGVDADMLLTAVSMNMYTPEAQWKDLSEALADAERGDATRLAELAEAETETETETETPDDAGSGDSGTGTGPGPGHGHETPTDNEPAVLQAVNCFDTPHPRDEAAYWKALAPAHEAAGRYGTSSILTALTCKDWPRTTDRPHRVRAAGIEPVLVVGTTGDAATPYEEAEGLASQFPGGMLLTYEGFGHTAYGRGDVCVTRHVDAYLIDRRAVSPGTAC
ncbi:alpha/beta hydrolase [Streptomyces sp. NPDC007325]|uniref:alpha/beta hydrolase n=1 Tax=Streptomyces sp. NPDC007325 TaxID=3154588 RepID=UPI00340746A2